MSFSLKPGRQYFCHNVVDMSNLISDKLKQSAPSRIVNVSSIGHKWAKLPLDFDNFNSEKNYNIGNIYFTSKLGNVLFTRELARRLEGTGKHYEERIKFICVMRKPMSWFQSRSDTKAGWRLEILGVESRGIVQSL